VGGVAGEVGRADFERGIGGKIAYAVPYDAKAAIAAAEQAKPFVEVAKAGKAGKELEFLALGLAGAPAPPAQSLLKRILGR
jgi:pilus assembly protein CpaE